MREDIIFKMSYIMSSYLKSNEDADFSTSSSFQYYILN